MIDSIERFRVGIALALVINMALALLLLAFQLGRHYSDRDNDVCPLLVVDGEDASVGAGGALEQGDAEALHLRHPVVGRVAGEPSLGASFHVSDVVFTPVGCDEAERQLTGERAVREANACRDCLIAGGAFALPAGGAVGSCRGLGE